MQIFECKWQTQVTLEITGQPFFTQMTDVPSKRRRPGLDSGRSVNRKHDSLLPYSTHRTPCLLFPPSLTLFICPSCFQFQALSSVQYFISQLHISPFFSCKSTRITITNGLCVNIYTKRSALINSLFDFLNSL